jgi:hypothetical protein
MRATAFSDTAVAAVFSGFPAPIRQQLLMLRKLILETAAATEGVGPIEECLKWGEPAYLTAVTKSGSTIRLGWNKKVPQQYAMYFNCKTNLIESFRTAFANDFKFAGNRALIFELGETPPLEPLRLCVRSALTYHQQK